MHDQGGVRGADCSRAARRRVVGDIRRAREHAQVKPLRSQNGKVLREVDPHLHSPCTGEHTRSTQAPKTRRGPRSRSSLTPFDLGFCGAPGRIRTCDRRIRSPIFSCLYVPRGAVSSQSIRSLLSFRVKGYRLLTSRSRTTEHKRSTHALSAASDGTSRGTRPSSVCRVTYSNVVLPQLVRQRLRALELALTARWSVAAVSHTG